MIPKGKLGVSGRDDDDGEMGIMTGWYIVEKLASDIKKITWNKKGCVPVVTSNSPVIARAIEIKRPLSLMVYPNPSRGYLLCS